MSFHAFRPAIMIALMLVLPSTIVTAIPVTMQLS